jgi:hypothetical protein
MMDRSDDVGASVSRVDSCLMDTVVAACLSRAAHLKSFSAHPLTFFSGSSTTFPAPVLVLEASKRGPLWRGSRSAPLAVVCCDSPSKLRPNGVVIGESKRLNHGSGRM